jgi:hypothetical protein
MQILDLNHISEFILINCIRYGVPQTKISLSAQILTPEIQTYAATLVTRRHLTLQNSMSSSIKALQEQVVHPSLRGLSSGSYFSEE